MPSGYHHTVKIKTIEFVLLFEFVLFSSDARRLLLVEKKCNLLESLQGTKKDRRGEIIERCFREMEHRDYPEEMGESPQNDHSEKSFCLLV